MRADTLRTFGPIFTAEVASAGSPEGFAKLHGGSENGVFGGPSKPYSSDLMAQRVCIGVLK